MRSTVLALLLSCVAATAATAAEKTVKLEVQGYDRTYTYHSPDAKGRLPLVLVLPESGVSGADALTQYRWSALADKEKFIAVGLDALPVEPAKAEMFQTNPSYWSDGSGRGNAFRGHLDDSAYVRAVLDDLDDRLSLDPKRIYATGIGNGGSMANELGVTLSGRLAAIAPVMGHLWDSDRPANAISVLMIYGAKDTVDPVEGGMGINQWTHGFDRRPAASDTAHAWAKDLACPGDPTVTSNDTMNRNEWTGCMGNASVEYVILPNQGHHWPGGVDDGLSSLGPNGSFDATGFIWQWFKDHPKG
jgi:polyhydroxybutyrate depolymerase